MVHPWYPIQMFHSLCTLSRVTSCILVPTHTHLCEVFAVVHLVEIRKHASMMSLRTQVQVLVSLRPFVEIDLLVADMVLVAELVPDLQQNINKQ